MSEECDTCIESDGNPADLNADLEELMDSWALSPAELVAAVGKFVIAYNDAVNDSFDCLDCKVNTRALEEYYTVTDEVWSQVNPDIDGMLCIGCVEDRLGRPLNYNDFPVDVPLNAMIRSGVWGGSARLKEAMSRV